MSETAGRKIFRRWRLGGFEYRSDIIAHDYMRRWMIKTPWFMLRLHHILRGDEDGEFHDHPMSFLSIILRGGYTEYRPYTGGLVKPLDLFAHEHAKAAGRFYGPGSALFRRGEDLHWLELPAGKTAWTFLITSPFYRDWGFQTEDGWIPAGKYDEWKRSKAIGQYCSQCSGLGKVKTSPARESVCPTCKGRSKTEGDSR